jgi:dihydroneopterin aldolase / 2-amino-4-hydroxy-6-hydroxymethyldihydropteridine diphosphokinase / dihydropteroate synthase
VRQPVRVSVSIPYDLRAAAEGDDISESINYGSLSKRVLASVEGQEDSSGSSSTRTFRSLEHLLDHIFRTCFEEFPEIQCMTLDVLKSRALPYADGIRVFSSRARDGSRLAPDRLAIQQLSCNVIVGLNQCEREDEQLVCFDVDMSTSTSLTPKPENAFDFRLLARDIRQVSLLVVDILCQEADHFVTGGRVLRVCIPRIARVPSRKDHASSRKSTG